MLSLARGATLRLWNSYQVTASAVPHTPFSLKGSSRACAPRIAAPACEEYKPPNIRKRSGDKPYPRADYFFTVCATGSYFKPASLASLFALSVFSQVNSGSFRPKCPYAAVLQ
jgi:hypothetical protein